MIELMTVLVVITIMSAIAFPNLMKWVPNYHLKAATQQLYGNMQKAKMAAVKTNKEVTFSFTTACPGGSYVFTDENGVTVVSVSMENGVCLSSSTFTNDSSGFTPTGLAAGNMGTVMLSHTNIARSYQISQSIAGGVRIQ